MVREKYIDAFKHIINAKEKYYPDDNDMQIRMSYDCANDILTLLKEQEAKSIVATTTEFLGVPMVTHHNCPKCGKGLYGASGQINYCSFCGQAVKLE